jgi:2-aminobenzoate-CoA ligase
MCWSRIYGVKPGNRVLIRSANNPAMVAVLAGGDQGRRGGGQHHADAARRGAWQDRRQGGDHARAVRHAADGRNGRLRQGKPVLKKVVGFDGTANHDAELDRLALSKPVRFERCRPARDDVALLGFTSGTTGMPKATMHFHRDMLIIADGYAKEVLGVTPEDVFVGSPPLAFTFGLGGLASFRCASARRRRCSNRRRRPTWSRSSRPTRPPSVLPRRPPTAPCWRDGGGGGPVSSCGRRCRRAKPLPGAGL